MYSLSPSFQVLVRFALVHVNGGHIWLQRVLLALQRCPELVGAYGSEGVFHIRVRFGLNVWREALGVVQKSAIEGKRTLEAVLKKDAACRSNLRHALQTLEFLLFADPHSFVQRHPPQKSQGGRRRSSGSIHFTEERQDPPDSDEGAPTSRQASLSTFEQDAREVELAHRQSVPDSVSSASLEAAEGAARGSDAVEVEEGTKSPSTDGLESKRTRLPSALQQGKLPQGKCFVSSASVGRVDRRLSTTQVQASEQALDAQHAQAVLLLLTELLHGVLLTNADQRDVKRLFYRFWSCVYTHPRCESLVETVGNSTIQLFLEALPKKDESSARFCLLALFLLKRSWESLLRADKPARLSENTRLVMDRVYNSFGAVVFEGALQESLDATLQEMLAMQDVESCLFLLSQQRVRDAAVAAKQAMEQNLDAFHASFASHMRHLELLGTQREEKRGDLASQARVQYMCTEMDAYARQCASFRAGRDSAWIHKQYFEPAAEGPRRVERKPSTRSQIRQLVSAYEGLSRLRNGLSHSGADVREYWQLESIESSGRMRRLLRKDFDYDSRAVGPAIELSRQAIERKLALLAEKQAAGGQRGPGPRPVVESGGNVAQPAAHTSGEEQATAVESLSSMFSLAKAALTSVIRADPDGISPSLDGPDESSADEGADGAHDRLQLGQEEDDEDRPASPHLLEGVLAGAEEAHQELEQDPEAQEEEEGGGQGGEGEGEKHGDGTAATPAAPAQELSADVSFTQQDMDIRRQRRGVFGVYHASLRSPAHTFEGFLTLTRQAVQFVGTMVEHMGVAVGSYEGKRDAADTNKKQIKSLTLAVGQIRMALPRLYLLRQSAVELFMKNGKTHFFSFEKTFAFGKDVDSAGFSLVQMRKHYSLKTYPTRRVKRSGPQRRNHAYHILCQLLHIPFEVNARRRLAKSGITDLWVKRKISNFEYLV
jgi:hypothetical protein